MLGIVLRGTLGRSGRKRARRATNFLTGHKGFLSASTIMAAAGVAWGIYDTLQKQGASCDAGGAWGACRCRGLRPAIPPHSDLPDRSRGRCRGH